MCLKLPIHSLRLISSSEAADQLNLIFMADPDDSYSDLLFTAWLAQQRNCACRSLATGDRDAANRADPSLRHAHRVSGARVSILFTGWLASGLFTAI